MQQHRVAAAAANSPAHRGFQTRGLAHNLLSTLLNMSEHAAEKNTPIYAMMYDLTQAYDRVQILSHFVRMFMSLITNTTTKFQTAHGHPATQ
jgi:hypothetical protein